jgi:hypothetical protein
MSEFIFPIFLSNSSGFWSILSRVFFIFLYSIPAGSRSIPVDTRPSGCIPFVSAVGVFPLDRGGTRGCILNGTDMVSLGSDDRGRSMRNGRGTRPEDERVADR